MILREVQEQLRSIANELSMPLLYPRSIEEVVKHLNHLADEISRRKSVVKAPPKARAMTPELAEAIRRDRKDNPKLTYLQLAQRYGVGVGRVSEAISGKRQ